ncbi:ankyrin repeat domain-containing protein [Sphaerisporangium album]|uniref:Ankyrin repeat domain-containing protein n=1 Tax=Sphaerisporangium album TaxID=509200 RepID=A0A367FJB7_9ACTN|nr:ankyrin repeat domain-containing protein [Sphaerisporangium album]RCG29797.1 ankyrin repeat domain-containing protein [Sphaerisporangium album]
MNSASIDRKGRSELHYAALKGDAGRVSELIAAGLDPNLVDGDGFVPLHMAAQEGHVDAARALLDNDAEVDAENRHGNTPLSVAVFNSRGRGDLMALLRERGADPCRENNYGQTPLGLAKLIANYDVAQYFADL